MIIKTAPVTFDERGNPTDFKFHIICNLCNERIISGSQHALFNEVHDLCAVLDKDFLKEKAKVTQSISSYAIMPNKEENKIKLRANELGLEIGDIVKLKKTPDRGEIKVTKLQRQWIRGICSWDKIDRLVRCTSIYLHKKKEHVLQ